MQSIYSLYTTILSDLPYPYLLSPITLVLYSSQDAFSDQWFLLERLTAREKETGLAKDVMEDIDSQVKEMVVSCVPL